MEEILISTSKGSRVHVSDVLIEWPHFFPEGVRPSGRVIVTSHTPATEILDTGQMKRWVAGALGSLQGESALPVGVMVAAGPPNEVHRRRGFWATSEIHYPEERRIAEISRSEAGKLWLAGFVRLPRAADIADFLVDSSSLQRMAIVGAEQFDAWAFFEALLRSPYIGTEGYLFDYLLAEVVARETELGHQVIRLWRQDDTFLDVFRSPA